MTGTNEPVWCWCHTCNAWIGSKPVLLPLYWSNRKAQGLHRSGSPSHRTELLDLRAVLRLAEALA